MTDTDESQSSASDYPDAQELIRNGRKEPHAYERNGQMEYSYTRQKSAGPSEDTSDKLKTRCESSVASAVVVLDSSDTEVDFATASGSGYHHPNGSIAPSAHKKASQSSRQHSEAVVVVPDSESSSDSSLSPQRPAESSETSKKSKLNLKAIFDYHFRGRKFRAAAHRKYKCGSGKKKKKKSSYESKRMAKGRKLTASPEEQRRRLLDRGFRFPFVEEHYGKKDIPLTMVLGYEQAAAKGYFRYIELLKYEAHLKKALKAIQAGEDLERECLAIRKHKYLDDEGSISPIEETNDDDLNSDCQEDFDARVVETSSFILSSKIPRKKKSKPGTKRAKLTEVIEIEGDDDDCC